MEDREPHRLALDYMTPSHPRRRVSLKYSAAVVFATVTIVLAGFAAYSGTMLFERAEALKSRSDRAQGRGDAFQMFVISAVLFAPAVWYGSVGIRGIRRGEFADE